MKIVFFGTDDFSVAVLDELKRAGILPVLIITAPDKPQGRGLKLTPSLVKLWAQKNKIAVSHEYPSSGELFIVASYGKIIPKSVLDIPKYGALNVHPSLLPKYRGPSPIESQILADEKEIGVTIMQMDEKMDHGPVVASQHIQKSSGLRKRLAEEGGKLLAEVIPRWIAGEIKPVQQDENKATYTKKFKKEDGEIDLNSDPYKNFLKIHAFNDGIGTYFFVGKTRVKIIDADFKNGKLEILRVIPEGKKEMSYSDFLRGVKN